MEKYFIVMEQNSLRKDYMDYLQNIKDVNVIAKKFMEDNQFESHGYSCSNTSFYIDATDKDYENYSNVLSDDLGNGLRKFKKNSKIGKAWIKTVKENNLNVLDKPYIPFYFKNTYGHMSTNIFMIDDVVYCYFKMEHDFEVPEGMTEIKASEYYKVIEDHKEKFQ